MATRRVGMHGESGNAFVWAGLVVFVLVVYAVVAVGGGWLLGWTGSPSVWLSIVATAIVALGFEPVRRWLTGLRASSPYAVLTAFNAQIGGAAATEEVLPRIARVLAEGTGAERAEVWLGAGPNQRLAAGWPPDRAALPVAAAFGIRTHEVRHQGELLGRLTLRERTGEPLTPLEERLFAELAGAAGLVLRNVGLTAALRSQVEEVARRAEELRASRERIVAAHDDARRRLERDIHDGAQQHLVALSVNLRLVRTLADRDADRARAALPDLRAASVATVETLRELSRGLYPRLLAEAGLVGALRAAAEHSPVPVELRDQGVGRYPAELEAAVYFCCLEALQNAAKHSRASRVVISLAGGAELSLKVADDGAGFRPADVEVASGLANMRDRIEAVGGTLEVASEPGQGTLVQARVVVEDVPVARVLP